MGCGRMYRISKKIGQSKANKQEWTEVTKQEKEVWRRLRAFLKYKDHNRKKIWGKEKKKFRDMRKRVKKEILQKS